MHRVESRLKGQYCHCRVKTAEMPDGMGATVPSPWTKVRYIRCRLLLRPPVDFFYVEYESLIEMGRARSTKKSPSAFISSTQAPNSGLGRELAKVLFNLQKRISINGTCTAKLLVVQLWGATAMVRSEIIAAWVEDHPAVPGRLVLPPLDGRLAVGRFNFFGLKVCYGCGR